MGIIVAAHAGTGKTHFARENSQIAVDLTYFCYRYDVPEDSIVSGDEGEAAKASFMYPEKHDYPQNYIDAIKSAMSERKFILIVPTYRVLDELEKEGIPYIVAYPVRSAREEYKRRFTARGNNEQFLEIFVDGWDEFIDTFQRNTYARQIIMKEKEYLSDVLDESMLDKDVQQIGAESPWKVFTRKDANLLDGEHIVIPPGCDEIGEFAFCGRSDIVSVEIPEGVSYIANSAFEYDYIADYSHLVKVLLPDSIRVIDSYAFGGCSELSDITFEKNVQSINAFAFEYCSSLKNITLPDSLENVGYGAFRECTGLADGGITYKGKTYEMVINKRFQTANSDDTANEAYYCDMSLDFYRAVNDTGVEFR